MGTVNQKFVGSVLGRILLAPKKDSSLQDRVEAIFCGAFSFREDEFPESARDAWKRIKNAQKKPLNEYMKVQYEARLIRKPKAVAGSLTRSESREVINAFLTIVASAMRR